MEPDEWLCAALSIKEAAKAFKLLSINGSETEAVAVRVLHKESGAVWRFDCSIERPGA